MDRPEEFEHIPWSELAAGVDHRRGRFAYILAGAILAVAVGAVVARAVWPTSAATTDLGAAPPATALPEAASASAVAPVVTALPEPELYSEADLLAVVPGDTSPAVAARAEWFVVDYFTSDLDPGGSLDVRRALPAGADVELPHEAVGGGVSYVEWARAFSIEVLGPTLHAVDVAFRAIGGRQGEPLLRLPVRAVRVIVQGDGFGMAVADLPSPMPLPAEEGAEPWPEAAGEIPDDIAAGALEAAGAWGESAVVVGGSESDGGWRVVVEAEDDAGNRWPLALWLDEFGSLAAPPWLEALHSGS